jgi:NhaP-type Na+/H+ or K+/H+ antiporter
LAAGVHQGFGGPEVVATLKPAQGVVPDGHLVQIEAAWLGMTAMFVLIGLGLLGAALRRTGWLYSLGMGAAVWFASIAAAFLWAAPRWAAPDFPPQAVLMVILAGLAGAAAVAAAPR